MVKTLRTGQVYLVGGDDAIVVAQYFHIVAVTGDFQIAKVRHRIEDGVVVFVNHDSTGAACITQHSHAEVVECHGYHRIFDQLLVAEFFGEKVA